MDNKTSQQGTAKGKNPKAEKGQEKSKKFHTSEFNREIPSDILGSYTGVPQNGYEVPEQDADDL